MVNVDAESIQMTAAGFITTPPRRAVVLAATAGRDLVYLLAVLAMSFIEFLVWLTGVSVTVLLVLLLVGLVVWLGVAYAFRGTATIDRLLAGWYRREPIAGLYRTPESRGFLVRVRTVTVDRQTWKDVAWNVLNSIVGFMLALLAISAFAAVLAGIAMPLWWSAPPTESLGIYTVSSLGWALVTTGIGLLLLPLSLAINHWLATGHAALAAQILGPSDRQRLSARVRELARTRADMVAASNEQLERIERDLHDGAQARLVALAMDLGMAEEELSSDPDAAREAVRKARDSALTALGELRDLSRGLRPALLQDRGLHAAVDDLAQRTPMPVAVTVRGEIERTPDAAQTAVYFVVAEALTNAAKHSGSGSARVSIERTSEGIVATVVDDGRGGANPDGTGLAGLRTRARALDGRLDVISPPGGPTMIRAEIPCA